MSNISDPISATNMTRSVLHAAITRQAPVSRMKNRPENTTGTIKLVSEHGKNARTTVQFDSTGQIVPSAQNVKKHSATADFINLLA